jgi:hypothetical protein
VSLELKGNASLTPSTGFVKPAFNVPVGGSGATWAQMLTTLGFGTGSGQANNRYVAQRTLGAGLNDDLDLSGSLTNDFGETLTLTKVKLLVVSIVAPDGTKKLRVGPQGVANAFQGPFGGVTAPCYKEVTHWDPVINEPVNGYTVTPGTGDILRINNPGAGSVTYNILIVGL